MRLFAENPACSVTSRLILMGNADSTEDFHLDYQILEDPSHHKVFINAMEGGKRFLICKEELEEHPGRSYLRCWRDDVMRLRAIFHEKTWFGFDLDDTLHEFRHSSGRATNKF
ncbi:hypothetical protein NXS19_007368 [Fusarium pseudograminearum]|nr:hypothetical protein NXS19_007368 [Fusarium pseudograminearum]